MISVLKEYINVLAGAMFLGFLAYMKYLKSTNEEQKENIDRLKKEIAVKKEVSKDEVKKAIFDTKQKTRAEELKKSEITLDEIEEEIRKNEKINDNSEHSSSDDFITSSV